MPCPFIGQIWHGKIWKKSIIISLHMYNQYKIEVFGQKINIEMALSGQIGQTMSARYTNFFELKQNNQSLTLLHYECSCELT